MNRSEKKNAKDPGSHKYSVVLLPSEVVKRGCTIGEAVAWVATWNSIMAEDRSAEIMEEKAA